MDTAREGGERGLLDETRVLVNEHVVKNVHSASNELFASQPLQAFKKFIEEKTKWVWFEWDTLKSKNWSREIRIWRVAI